MYQTTTYAGLLKGWLGPWVPRMPAPGMLEKQPAEWREVWHRARATNPPKTLMELFQEAPAKRNASGPMASLLGGAAERGPEYETGSEGAR